MKKLMLIVTAVLISALSWNCSREADAGDDISASSNIRRADSDLIPNGSYELVNYSIDGRVIGSTGVIELSFENGIINGTAGLTKITGRYETHYPNSVLIYLNEDLPGIGPFPTAWKLTDQESVDISSWSVFTPYPNAPRASVTFNRITDSKTTKKGL